MNTTIEPPAISEPTAGTAVPILSVTERAALLECESIIRTGRAVFVQVGTALARIRDSRLYREKHATFEEYCLAEWEITDRFARNLRSAADVVHVLQEKQFAVLPATESQARPITKLPREEWGPAWEEVLGTAPAGRVTAGHVASVVQSRFDRLTHKPVSSETEVLRRPAPAIDAGTREEKIMAAAAVARAKLRELQDLVRTADGDAMGKVELAIRFMDGVQEHVKRVQQMHSNRKADV